MHAAPFHLQDHLFHLEPEGALYWPAQRVLIVADLHLEKGSAAARQGHLVPPWDSRLTLDRLARLLRRLNPATVIALGDSFHDVHGAARMAQPDTARLRDLTQQADFVWIQGNHDPLAPAGIGGRHAPEWSLGGIVFRHQASAGFAGEISGHFHPKARVPTRAGEVVRPCFVADARKIMLPAFGAYTGGLNVRAPSIAAHFPHGGRVFLLGQHRLFSFPLRQSTADPLHA
jgi:DNA ligase-associated metallophosphoesterase